MSTECIDFLMNKFKKGLLSRVFIEDGAFKYKKNQTHQKGFYDNVMSTETSTKNNQKSGKN